jgi:hypothetical protein
MNGISERVGTNNDIFDYLVDVKNVQFAFSLFLVSYCL